MILDMNNDQLMAMAGHRYSLGRRSYIVPSCIEWLESHWSQLAPSTQCTILRDTIRAIARNEAGGEQGIDVWSRFAVPKARELNAKEKLWLCDSIRHEPGALGILNTIEAA